MSVNARIATRKYLLYNCHQRFIFVNYFCVNSKKLEYDVVIVGGLFFLFWRFFLQVC